MRHCAKGLLDRLEFIQRNADWTDVSDSEIIRLATNFIKKHGINGRFEFQKKSKSYYYILRKRNLLSLIFAGIESEREKSVEMQYLSGLAHAPEAMEKFGEQKD